MNKIEALILGHGLSDSSEEARGGQDVWGLCDRDYLIN